MKSVRWGFIPFWADDPDEAKYTPINVLVETVFSMLKLRFGRNLRLRRYREQRQELLFKILLHNNERLNFVECDGRWLFTQGQSCSNIYSQ